MTSTLLSVILLLGVIYAIACFVLYHKVFTVRYFNLKMGIWREIIVCMLIGVALSGLTLYFWWIICIILIIAAFWISSKSESHSKKQFIWIAILILCIIVAVAGRAMKHSLKEAGNEEIKQQEYMQSVQQKKENLENSMYNVSAYFDDDSKIVFTKDNTVQLIKQCKFDTGRVTGDNDDEAVYVTLEKLLNEKMTNVKWENMELGKASVTGTLSEDEWQGTNVKIIFQAENLSYYPESDSWELYAIWEGQNISDTEDLFYSFISKIEDEEMYQEDNEDEILDYMYQDDTEEDTNKNKTVDYFTCYQPILSNIPKSAVRFLYCLYDLDNDGIMELIVENEEVAGGFLADIYTIENNEPVYLSNEHVCYASFYETEDRNGLYISYGHMGYEYVYRITKQGHSINIENAWTIETGGLMDYYENDHPILKCDVYDSSLLRNPPSANPNPVMVEESHSYVFRTSSCQYLTESDLIGLDAFTCKIARNEIYARYARLFNDPELQTYFNGKSWYYGLIEPDEFDDSKLNGYERANLDLIIQYESDKGYR